VIWRFFNSIDGTGVVAAMDAAALDETALAGVDTTEVLAAAANGDTNGVIGEAEALVVDAV